MLCVCACVCVCVSKNDEIVREAAMMRKLRHHNIVQVRFPFLLGRLAPCIYKVHLLRIRLLNVFVLQFLGIWQLGTENAEDENVRTTRLWQLQLSECVQLKVIRCQIRGQKCVFMNVRTTFLFFFLLHTMTGLYLLGPCVSGHGALPERRLKRRCSKHRQCCG